VGFSQQFWGEKLLPATARATDALEIRTMIVTAPKQIREKFGPIVLCMGNSLTLIKGKERETIPFIKQHYTGLKEVSHITLGTFVLLINHTDETLGDKTISKLQAYKAGIEKAAPKVTSDEGLEPNDEARQKELIAETLAFLSKVIIDKHVSADQLQAFVRKTSVPDLDNAYEAAGSQLNAMDKAMSKWHKEMSSDEWNQLYVFIATAHMPRQQLLAYQYFAKLLNQSEEGHRVIVGENPGTTTEEQAFDLIATHILDRKMASNFFNDPWRMHRDLLSDAAKSWLEKHKLEAALSH